MMRYGSPAAACLLLIWRIYAWFHGRQELALIVFAVFAVGVPFFAYHVWRELRRGYGAEVLEELKREREQENRRQAGQTMKERGQWMDGAVAGAPGPSGSM
jgi:sugar phosphate permease